MFITAFPLASLTGQYKIKSDYFKPKRICYNFQPCLYPPSDTLPLIGYQLCAGATFSISPMLVPFTSFFLPWDDQRASFTTSVCAAQKFRDDHAQGPACSTLSSFR